MMDCLTAFKDKSSGIVGWQVVIMNAVKQSTSSAIICVPHRHCEILCCVCIPCDKLIFSQANARFYFKQTRQKKL
ncbi:hypothetical protein [Helicobacter sp. MIT 05-5294]|uniref:hypothetical protein n=1 Tax=Helicobacter sp. MIT 05-5294 TaxID=1548150 RepID=UPI0010FF0488|nr:hypothetical protein [Helicobacter sp. MIT 05-5294]TLD85480.1 hypothetical protein LS69_009275 [Helicobacter sp. MIT 05-5294]